MRYLIKHLCVVCKREQKAGSPARNVGSSLNSWLVLGTIFMVLLAAGILGYGMLHSSEDEIDDSLAMELGDRPAQAEHEVEEPTPAAQQEPPPAVQQDQPSGMSEAERRRRNLERARRRVRIKMYMTDW